MTDELFKSLEHIETDVEGALYRLSNDKAMYVMLLRAFENDDTMAQLEASIKSGDWDNAFTAAHALKGLAGNMGFTPLFHAIGELVILIRAGKIESINSSYDTVRKHYDDIAEIIRNYCM
ncbi:MAG: Hpt domain-containing protein [Clostridiales bacterium]|nr:Hpt domain-containing protein [Clostridiales bacterium]